MTSLRTHVVTVRVADLPQVKSLLTDAAIDLSMARQLVVALAGMVDIEFDDDGEARLSPYDQDAYTSLGDIDLSNLLAEWLGLAP